MKNMSQQLLVLSVLLCLSGSRLEGAIVSLTWGSIAPMQYLDQPVPVTLWAMDEANNVATNFNGSVTFTSSVPVWPANSGSFSNGVWTGTIQMLQAASNVVLTADDGSGHTGQSDAFQVLALDAGPLPASATDCLTPLPGLVAWWRGDGDALDYAGTNNGSITGGVTFQPGAVGQAFIFDGITGGVTVPASSNLTSQTLTIEGWIYPTDTSAQHPILCYSSSTGNAGVEFWVEGGSLSALLRGPLTGASGIGISGGSIPANQWSHVALVYDYAGAVVLYVNGAWQSSYGGWANPIQIYTSYPVELGYLPSDTSDSLAGKRFAGLLDEFAIYNRALSAAEIQAICSAGSNGKCSGSVPPAFITLPVGATNIAGTSASFSAVASGVAPLNYQWQKNGLALTDGGNVAGAATANLTLQNVQDADVANFSVVLSNAFGSQASALVALAVLDDPIILMQPTAISNVLGSTATFTADAYGGAPLSYQWQKDDVDLTDGGNISGSTTPTLTLNNVSQADAGNYRLIASNAYGLIPSSEASLTVMSSLVVGWGYLTDVPLDLTNALSVSAGFFHNLALRSDGTVTAWGDDGYGQCDVPAGLTNVIAVAGGGDHSLALKADGTVVAWGAGTVNTGSSMNYGQSIIPGGLTNVIAIAAGSRNSMALKSNGSVVEWGYNGYQQNNPPASLTNAIAIAGANDFSLALKADGTVVKWGASYTNPNIGSVPAGLSNVVAISAGLNHSLALKADGTMVAWGDNQYGEGVVPSNLTNVVAISAGVQYYNIAMRSDGSVVAWGNNTSGVTNIPIGVSYAISISAGMIHGVAALMNNGLPTVLKQPNSQKLAKGKASAFNVLAVGAPGMAYRWKKNEISLTDAGNLSGTATPNLSINNVQSSDVAVYTVAITNIAGHAVSSPATLSTIAPVAINTQPASRTNIAGTAASFTVNASGTPPLAYQWLKNSLILTNGNNASGANSNLLILTGVALGDAANYSLIVTNIAGSATSSVVSLSVVVPSPNILFQNTDKHALKLSFAGIPDYKYRIQYSESLANPSWQDFTNQTADSSGACSIQVPFPTNNLPMRFYRCVWP